MGGAVSGCRQPMGNAVSKVRANGLIIPSRMNL